MRPAPLPSQAYLQECLSYNLMTGALTWTARPRCHFARQQDWNRWNTINAGRRTGRKNKDGYIIVTLDRKNHYAHRLIWKLVVGFEPHSRLDHRSRNRADNNLRNLRESTSQQNAWNRSTSISNASGLKGVYANRRRGCFYARIWLNGKRVHLGMFATAEGAHEAYQKASMRAHGGFSIFMETTKEWEMQR